MTAFVSTDISITNGSTTVTVNDNVDFSQISTSSVLFVDNNSPVIVDAGTAPDTPTSGASQLTLRSAWADATVTNGKALLLVGMNALVDAITKANDSGTILANMTAAQADLFNTTNAAYPIQISSSQSVNVPTWPYMVDQFSNGVFSTLTSNGPSTMNGDVTVNSSTGLPLKLNSTSGNTNIEFQENGTTNWFVRNIASDNSFSIYSALGAVEAISIDSLTGNATFEANIRLNTSEPIYLSTNNNTYVREISGALHLGTGGTSSFNIDASQNATFTGHIGVNRDSKANTACIIQSDDSGSTNYALAVEDPSFNSLLLVRNDGEATFTGNVGIGTSSPDNVLHVEGGNNKGITVDRGDTAVSMDINYVDATTDFEIGTSTAHKLRLKTGGTTALTLDNSQNATFAGSQTINATNGLASTINSTNANGAYQEFRNSGTTVADVGSGAQIVGTSTNEWGLNTRPGIDLILGAGNTKRVTIDSSTGNATFAGKVELGGGANASPTGTAADHLSFEFLGYAGYVTGDGTAMYLGHNSASRNLTLRTANVDALTIDGSQNAAFNGYVTMEGFSSSIDSTIATGLDAVRHLYMGNLGVASYIGVCSSGVNSRFTGNTGYAATWGTTSARPLELATSNIVRMRIAADGSTTLKHDTTFEGNVGIGVASDSAYQLLVKGTGTTDATTSFTARNGNNLTAFAVRDDLNCSFGGNVGINTNPSTDKLNIYADGVANILCEQATTNPNSQINFRNPNGEVGSITTSGTATSYNTSSDPRLKDFLEVGLTDEEINEAFNKLQSSFRRFTWKNDPDGDVVWGFDAHACVDAGLDMGTEGTGPRNLAIGDVYETEEIPEVTEEVTEEVQVTITKTRETTSIEVIDGVPTQVTKTEEYEEPVFEDIAVVDVDGNPVTQLVESGEFNSVPKLDENGDAVTEMVETGEFVDVLKLDENGEPVVELVDSGEVEDVPSLDVNGDPVVELVDSGEVETVVIGQDEDGNDILEEQAIMVEQAVVTQQPIMVEQEVMVQEAVMVEQAVMVDEPIMVEEAVTHSMPVMETVTKTVVTQEASTIEKKVTSAGVDQAKAVPILLAKIKQQDDLIQELLTRVVALEG